MYIYIVFRVDFDFASHSLEDKALSILLQRLNLLTLHRHQFVDTHTLGVKEVSYCLLLGERRKS